MSRFYSTENNGEQKEASQEGGENAEAEDSIRKELEQKEKEILDLKVCALVFCVQRKVNLTLTGQIPPLSRRLPQPAGAY